MGATDRRGPGGPDRGTQRNNVQHGRPQHNTDARQPVDRLLPRLERVRECGPGRWMAGCPAHEDRRASLSVRETDDGTILLHDFAGCAAVDVLAAVGLELRDLFAERLVDHGPRRDRHHRHAARDALKIVAREAEIAMIAAEHLAGGLGLDDADRERLAQAAGRIRSAMEAVG